MALLSGPLRPCAWPGCPELVKGARYCPEHARRMGRAEDSNRGTARERGYTRSWEKTRLYVLAQEPLCRECSARGQACSLGLGLFDDEPALLPFVCAARDAIVQRLLRPSGLRWAWVLTTDPTKRQEFRACGATIILIETPREILLSRLRGRLSSAVNYDAVLARWDGQYEPDDRDFVVKGC